MELTALEINIIKKRCGRDRTEVTAKSAETPKEYRVRWELPRHQNRELTRCPMIQAPPVTNIATGRDGLDLNHRARGTYTSISWRGLNPYRTPRMHRGLNR